MRIKKVVTIGGGTGSFVLLSGLRNYPVEISAIVSMTDDGGSTGVLRDELGVLPPGDVRQCLVALSNSSQRLRELMNYRFEDGSLKGHSFGNLLLSALEKIEMDFAKGVKIASEILNAKGEIIPVTCQNANLFIGLKNGKILKGQSEINHNYEIEKVGIAKNYISPRVKANPRAIEKILEADLVVVGPGSYYCSIVPNFLVEGISKAIQQTKAKVVYNCNLVNKKGHTENFTVDDYVASINKYIGKERIDFVTFNIGKASANLVEKYEKEQEFPIKISDKKIKRNYKIIRADLLSRKSPQYPKSDPLYSQRSFIRHDSQKLAGILMMISELGKYKSLIKDII